MFSTSKPESNPENKFSSVALFFIFLMISSNGFSAFLTHKLHSIYFSYF